MVVLRSDSRQQTTKTWTHWTTAQAPRLLHDPWPQVFAKCEGGTESGAVSTESANGAWLRALAAIDELTAYRDFTTICRRGVELLREAIGLERAAVFLLDTDQAALLGTFGSGPLGETTDERHISFAIGQSHREAFALAEGRMAQWSRFAGVPLFAQSGNQTIILRTGENVIVPIPGSGSSVGLIACDWALSGQSANVEALLRAAVFARTLGPMLERCRLNGAAQGLSGVTLSEKESRTHGPYFAMQHQGQASSSVTESAADHSAWMVAHVVCRLRVNPNETRHELARHLGITASRLGRVFKAALGQSLQIYRNRLRLERFIAIVDPGGGDLLPAALDAGFGSYAQFHRVFRQCFGCSPVDYLRRRRL